MKYLSMRSLVSYVFTVLLVSSFAACGGAPDDHQIEERLNKQLQESEQYKGVSASVAEGAVILTGTCEGEGCAAGIEEKVRIADGVKSIENNVVESTETDLTLRSSVQTIISKYPGVQADVAAGNIVLRGSISRDQVQPMMNELQALQPKKIDNQLAIN